MEAIFLFLSRVGCTSFHYRKADEPWRWLLEEMSVSFLAGRCCCCPDWEEGEGDGCGPRAGGFPSPCPLPLSRPASDDLLDLQQLMDWGQGAPGLSLPHPCLQVIEPLWASVLPSVKW